MVAWVCLVLHVLKWVSLSHCPACSPTPRVSGTRRGVCWPCLELKRCPWVLCTQGQGVSEWQRKLSHLMAGRKQREKERWLWPVSPLRTARPYLPKFPQLPKIASPAGNQAFNTEPVGDISLSNHDNCQQASAGIQAFTRSKENRVCWGGGRRGALVYSVSYNWLLSLRFSYQLLGRIWKDSWGNMTHHTPETCPPSDFHFLSAKPSAIKQNPLMLFSPSWTTCFEEFSHHLENITSFCD
jgi:hypothetical protein